MTLGAFVLSAVPSPAWAEAVADQEAAAWSMRPVPPVDGASSTAFELTEVEGTTVELRTVVSNLSDTPLTLDVGATDATTAADGSMTLLPPDAPPSGLGAWITSSATTVTVEAHAEAEVPFTIAIPANASPGDYTAGLITSFTRTQQDSAGQNVLVESRVGVRVFLRIPGTLVPELTISDVTVVRTGPWWNPFAVPVEIDALITNSGNARLEPTAVGSVTGPWGWLLGESEPRELPMLLPGDEVRLSELATASGVAGPIEVGGAAAVGVVTGGLDVLARVVDQTDAYEFHVEQTQLVIPWALILLALIIVGAVVWWLIVRRRRRGAADEDAVIEPQGDGGGGAGTSPSPATDRVDPHVPLPADAAGASVGAPPPSERAGAASETPPNSGVDGAAPLRRRRS